MNGLVYVGLRGDNKIMIFDEAGEKLVQKFSFKVGDWPRHFVVSKEGNLIVACQKENKVMKFFYQGEKIFHLSEMEIEAPAVVVLYP